MPGTVLLYIILIFKPVLSEADPIKSRVFYMKDRVSKSR